LIGFDDVEPAPPRFTLTELTEASGLTARTIRYYIELGLVSPALGRGRSRYYTPEHLQQLTVVAGLREQRISVDEIRQRLYAPPPQSASSPLDAAPAWRRIALHPSLELHVLDGAPDGILALARELEAQARAWLGDDDELSDAT
jgi:DNA-binding transcriptional MerR regulator